MSFKKEGEENPFKQQFEERILGNTRKSMANLASTARYFHILASTNERGLSTTPSGAIILDARYHDALAFAFDSKVTEESQNQYGFALLWHFKIYDYLRHYIENISEVYLEATHQENYLVLCFQGGFIGGFKFSKKSLAIPVAYDSLFERMTKYSYMSVGRSRVKGAGVQMLEALPVNIKIVPLVYRDDGKTEKFLG